MKEQLLRAGVMETVKIRQSGFPVRFEYDRAWEKYEKMNLHKLVRGVRARSARILLISLSFTHTHEHAHTHTNTGTRRGTKGNS